MFFAALVLFAAFLIEGIGTYVSVVGLSSLFAANMVIIILAVALDIGKITSVSFLYKYWGKVNLLMRTYMTVAAMVLMLITSAGAFGYLSGQFQKAISNTNQNGVVLTALTDEQGRLQKRKEEIDKQIAKLPDSSVTGRRQLMRQFAPEVDRINGRLVEIDKKLPELKIENLKQGVEVGPILYIAEAFDTTPEKAVKWVILTIIFVFDPLAIALLLAGNYLIEELKRPVKKEPGGFIPLVPPVVAPVDVPIIEELVAELVQESVEFPTRADTEALMDWHAQLRQDLEVEEPVAVEEIIPVVEEVLEPLPEIETLPAALEVQPPEVAEFPDEEITELPVVAPVVPELPVIIPQELEAVILPEPLPPVDPLNNEDEAALARRVNRMIAANEKREEVRNEEVEQAIKAVDELLLASRQAEREIIRLDEVTKSTPKVLPVHRSQLEDISARSDVETDEGNQRVVKMLAGTYMADSIPEPKRDTLSVGGPSDRI
jgi:hypothetical protein